MLQQKYAKAFSRHGPSLKERPRPQMPYVPSDCAWNLDAQAAAVGKLKSERNRQGIRPQAGKDDLQAWNAPNAR
jgi:hypothetical protein